ncbi:MAG: Thivi_2564 family membrane protein [Smithella sp.]
MPLIQLVLILFVVGFILWAFDRFLPMQSSIRTTLNVMVIIVVSVWRLIIHGVIGNLSAIRIGKGKEEELL